MVEEEAASVPTTIKVTVKTSKSKEIIDIQPDATILEVCLCVKISGIMKVFDV